MTWKVFSLGPTGPSVKEVRKDSLVEATVEGLRVEGHRAFRVGTDEEGARDYDQWLISCRQGAAWGGMP